MVSDTALCFGNKHLCFIVHHNFERILCVCENSHTRVPCVKSNGARRALHSGTMNPRFQSESSAVRRISPMHFHIFGQQRTRDISPARTSQERPFFTPGPYNHELISPRRRIIYELYIRCFARSIAEGPHCFA